MSWLNASDADKPTPKDWAIVQGIATQIHDILQRSDDPNWNLKYDRIFDRIMDRMLSGDQIWWANAQVVHLLSEDEIARKSISCEFQVSRNRWKNLKVEDKIDVRQALLDVVVNEDCTLTPMEGFILICRYVHGVSMSAIGEMLGYDRQFISSALDAIAEKLILEMGERVDVHVASEPEPIVMKEVKFDSRFVPGAHRRAR
jgi:hypothetical protein